MQTSTTKTYKFQFQIEILQAIILIPFRCQMQILLKRGQQKITTKKKIKLNGGQQIHPFNQILCLKTGLNFDGRIFASKDASISLILMTQMGNKIGGVLSINMSNFMNKKLADGKQINSSHQSRYDQKFQRSPDSQAMLSYILRSKFLYQSQDDSSMGSSVSVNSNNSMFNNSKNNLLDITFRIGQSTQGIPPGPLSQQRILSQTCSTSMTSSSSPYPPVVPSNTLMNKSRQFRKQYKQNSTQHSRIIKQKNQQNQRLIKRIAQLQKQATQQLNKHNQMIRKYDQDRLNILTSFQKTNQQLQLVNQQKQSIKTKLHHIQKQGYQSQQVLYRRLRQLQSILQQKQDSYQRANQQTQHVNQQKQLLKAKLNQIQKEGYQSQQVSHARIRQLQLILQQKSIRQQEYLQISRSFDEKLRLMQQATYKCNSDLQRKDNEILTLRQALSNESSKLNNANNQISRINQQYKIFEQRSHQLEMNASRNLNQLNTLHSQQIKQKQDKLKEYSMQYNIIESKLKQLISAKQKAEQILISQVNKTRQDVQNRMKIKISQLQNSFNNIQKQHKQQIQLQKQKIKLAQSTALKNQQQYQKHLQQLKTQLLRGKNQLQQAIYKNSQRQKLIQEMKVQFQKNQNSKLYLKNSVEQLQKQNRLLKQSFVTFQQNKKNIQNNKMKIESQLIRLQQQCYTLALQKSCCIDKISDNEKKYEQKLNEYKQKQQRYKKELQKLKMVEKTLEVSKNYFEQEYDKVILKLKEGQETRNKLIQNNKILKQELQKNNKQFKQYKFHHDTISSKSKILQQKINHLQKQLHSKNQIIQKNHLQLFKYKQSTYASQQQLNAFKQKHTKICQTHATQKLNYQKQYQILQNTYQQLENALKSMNQKNRNLQEKLQQTQQITQSIKQQMKNVIVTQRQTLRSTLQKSNFKKQQYDILQEKCRQLGLALNCAQNSLIDKDSIISQCWDSINRMQQRLAQQVRYKLDEQQRISALQFQLEKQRKQLQQRLQQKDRHLQLLKDQFESALNQQRTLFAQIQQENAKLQDQLTSLKSNSFNTMQNQQNFDKFQKLAGLAYSQCQLVDSIRTRVEFLSSMLRQSKMDTQKPWIYKLEKEQTLDKLKQISLDIMRKDLKDVIFSFYDRDFTLQQALKQKLTNSNINITDGNSVQWQRKLQQKQKISVRREQKIKRLQKQVKKLEEQNLRLNVKMMKQLSELKRRHQSRYKVNRQ